jgi:hypothetical protein
MNDYDQEIIKDLIVENNPDIKREDIKIDNVWDWDISRRMGEYIMVDYTTLIFKNIYGHKKEFIKNSVQSIMLEQYEQRLKEKLRDENFGKLGI